MKGNPPLPFDSRPIVLLFANPSGLSITLTETLLSNFCRVQIISSDKDDWEDAASHLANNKGVSVQNFSETLSFESFEYILMIDRGFDGGLDIKKSLNLLGGLLDKNPANTLFILPYLQYSTNQGKLAEEVLDFYKKRKDTTGVVFVGQTLGTRVSLNDTDLLLRIIKDAIVEGEIKVPSGETRLYPVHVSAASKEIVRLLFSFSGVGQKSLVVGHKTNVSEVVGLSKKYVSALNVKYTEEDWGASLPQVKEKRVLSLDLAQSLKETFEWYSSHPPRGLVKSREREERTREPKEEKKVDVSRIELPQLKPFPKKPSRFVNLFNKTTALIAGLIVGILLLPYLLLAIGGGSLALAKSSLMNGRLALAGMTNGVSFASAKASSAEFYLLSSAPLIGGVFGRGHKTALLMEDISGLVRRTIRIADLSNEFLAKILGEGEYEVSLYSEPISLELDSLYRELSFLESEHREGRGLSAWVFDRAVKDANLEETRLKILPAQRIVKEAPFLLGGDEVKQYLVLFQNNMELRPTGGFIGSFALVTFDKGRLVDIKVQDVYSADGQLRGHVEPPKPINEYLGEANWFLRDSNWDPDFPVSAQRAEWFLDKEIDVAVDGVIAIDLEFAKSLVGVSGPIYLEDFDKKITQENLYEVTQYEVEDDFFPGSRKKANFLTSLTRELLNELLNTKDDKYLDTALAVVDSLQKKHIQVFLHNNSAQRAIADLGWSGEVYQPTCPGNCFADYLGIVEANLGVNKANYFIKRNTTLDIKIGGSAISHTLSINIENTANAALGDGGAYENYIRVIAPLNSVFSEVLFEGPNSEDLFEPDVEDVRGRKEAGVFVEISPGQKRSIIYRWETPTDLVFDENGQYRIVWRKQAGTVSDTIQVSIVAPFTENSVTIPPATLTEAGAYRYNTELAEDFAPRIFW